MQRESQPGEPSPFVARDRSAFEDSLARFDAHRQEYIDLAKELGDVVPRRLKLSGLKHFRVEARAKKRKSFKKKLKKDPRREIEDMVGVRILVFFRSDIVRVEQAMSRLLMLDERSYIDKSGLIADDAFGYRSVQFVGRTKEGGWDDEPGKFERMIVNRGTKVEVQIRTMLEHAWAEVEHDFRYKPKSSQIRSATVDRQFALTAALLEQADSNLDGIRTELAGNVPIGKSVTPGVELRRWDLQRFVQSNRESLALDVALASALNIPPGRDPKANREITSAAALAGWRSYEQLQAAVREHGRLGLRLAIACADPTHPLVLIDYPHPEFPRAFRGVGLYWTALAYALGVANAVHEPQSTTLARDDVEPVRSVHLSIPDGRVAEFRAVATYLVEHPGASALAVRDAYRRQAAPAGTQDPSSFHPIKIGN